MSSCWWSSLWLYFSLTFLWMLVASEPRVSGSLNAEVEPSVAREGVTGLNLLCRYTPLPNETLLHVTWSKLKGNDVSAIFEKSFSGAARRTNYTFHGSWDGRKARHYEMTLADVSLRGNDVTREDAGMYRCEVSSDVSTVYSDTNVTVLYGPGTSIHITSQQGSFRTEEGETIALFCTASCFPSCRFRWTCAGCVATRKATLTIPSIQRDQSGMYTCLAYNNVSRGRADVRVDVLYPSYLQHLHFAGGGRTLEVEEGQSVSISCQATGNPSPHTITWSVSGQSKDNKTFEMRYGHDKSSVYMLSSASCHDNDEYTCTTANGVGADMDSVHLRVLCAPVVDTETCHSDNSTYVISYSQSANITVCVIARPRPTVRWYRVIDDVGVDVATHDITYDDVRARLMTWISVTAADEHGYGFYRVFIENEKGSYAQNISLVSREPPQPPQNLTITNVTMTSFCLTWLAAFDGGAQQSFLLTYTIQNDDVHTKNSTIRTINSEDDVIRHCVEGLHHNTVYEVFLSAENVFGKSEESHVNVTTLPGMKSQPVTLGSALWAKVGTPLVMIVLVLFLVVSLLVYRRRQRRFENSTVQRTEIKHQTHLCINNENVRLSYLESSRRSSYVDATSPRVIIDDVISHGNDVSGGRGMERSGSLFDLDRRLGVDDLSRRPSSTPSSNIYLDVLGEPSTYINQDTSEQNSSSYMNTHRDTWEPGATNDNNADTPQCQERLTGLFDYYVDMSGGAETDDHNMNPDSDDVTLNSADYDDAWCSNLPSHAMEGPGQSKPSSHQESLSQPLSYQESSTPSGASHDVTVTPEVTAIPTITIQDERGVTRDCAYHVCEVTTNNEYEEHVYDVIKDSDVED